MLASRQAKYSLCAPADDYDWAGFAAVLEAEAGPSLVELSATAATPSS